MKKKPLHVNYNSEDVSDGYILFLGLLSIRTIVRTDAFVFLSTLYCLPAAIQLNGY